MSTQDTHWKQRLQNFNGAVENLEKALQISNPSDVERAGIIQFFEIAFELAWKTTKDYLNETGYDIKNPRDTIKQAFQDGVIENGHIWIEMLEARNVFSHTYDEETAEAAVEKIRTKFFPHIRQVHLWLKKQS